MLAEVIGFYTEDHMVPSREQAFKLKDWLTAISESDLLLNGLKYWFQGW